MTEANEVRSDDLENRLTKIEEYIRCSEKTKEQQWRNGVDKKLENIKAEIKEQSEKSNW